MAISNAPLEWKRFSPYELNLGYCHCLAPEAFWDASERPCQSKPAKLWIKQMEEEWKHAHDALQAIKDKQMSRANRNRENANFKVGDYVLARMFPVIRKQLNEGGPFADRWAEPCRIREIVSHDSFRLELPIKASSRMGRVFNAIELKPYHERDPGDAVRAA